MEGGAEPRIATDYDVVVVGGAFSGASAALLLRRWIPEARVLVVERQESFRRKVGEATVEVSGMFLTRILKLYDYLATEHLFKHGLRFWFSDSSETPLSEMSEIGPHRISALPSFQLDRSRLDEEILARAEGEGAEVLRPAKVTGMELGWPVSRLTVQAGGDEREVTTRWVLDASGRQTFVARRLGLVEDVPDHPTAAAWGRWRGVQDLDGPRLAGDPGSPRLPEVAASRRLATNHFSGYGWWCWVIPLAGGETSVGLVWDKRLFDWPVEGRIEDRYRDFVTRRIAGLSELLAEATPVEDDFLAYRDLPYLSSRYMEKGWSLLGDAAAFMDPFYSPGLDHAAITIYATARILRDDLAGELGADELADAVAEHNRRFARSFERWLGALYLDKYEIFGDAELTTASFLFDTGMYYLGVVGPIWRDVENFRNPVLGTDHVLGKLSYRIMRLFKSRMVRLARFRRRAGIYGRKNVGWRVYPTRFEIQRRRAAELVVAGTKIWLRAEAELLWHRLRHGGMDLSSPVPELAEGT